MRILLIGDIVARPGRAAVNEVLPKIIEEENVEFVIANAENLAHGRGATAGTLDEMMDAGVDFFTGGDHLFWHKGFDKEVENYPIIRPANYPETMAGDGYKIVEADQARILIINLMGQAFINEPVSNPFNKIEEILEQVEENSYDISIVDLHAEATSDKIAFGFFVDGKIDAVFGTHTHVPTCDERVLPKGTMFITDAGMTGNIDSVLGVKKEIIIDRVVHANKQRFVWELEGRTEFRSVLVDTDTKEIKRVDRKLY